MKRIIPVIIILAAAGGGYWWYTQQNATALNNPAETALVGSGTIEADTLTVTAELGGRITEVLVDEGDDVTAGQTLIQLDTSDLLARQAELEALIATARANLELASAPPRPEDVRLAEAQLAQTEQVRDGAKLVWEQAQQLARDPLELDAQINQAKAQINQAEKNLENARVQLKRAEIQAEAASRNQSNNVGLAQNEAAQLQLQAAQQGVKLAEMAVSGAQKQVSLLQNLRDRPLSLLAQVNAAEAAYKQTEAAVLAAQANLTAAKANPTPEDVNIARAQLAEAEAGLDVLAVQLEKQTLTAPRNGRISQKLVNPGEMAAPGLILLELRDLSTVDLTVYIPETQIGRVQLGQKANVQVDAYPAETFAGRVSFIAHQAEFTPKNVQTQEERVNLVFGVKITLANPDGRLKPGMPADAEITADMWDGPLPGGGSAAAQSQSSGQNTPPPTPTPTATATPKPTATPLPRPTDTPAPTATPKPARQAEVTAFAVRVRSGPGLDFELVSHLNQGDVVPVLATDPDTGWLQIQLPNNDTGWITGSSTFVTVR